MGNYCPYTNRNVVYLQCRECEDKICEKDWFFCGVAGAPLSMMKSRKQMSEYLDKMLAKREKVVIAAESGKKIAALAAMQMTSFADCSLGFCSRLTILH